MAQPGIFMESLLSRFCKVNFMVMERGKILQADYLDLVFDNRNKLYGSYELRKHYNRRATKALGITCLVILLGIGTPVLLGHIHAEEPAEATWTVHETPTQLTDIRLPELTKPPQRPTHPAAPQRSGATVRNTPPVIVQNEQVSPELKPPDVHELKDKLSGPVTSPGEEGEAIAMTAKPHKGIFGDGYSEGKEKTGGSALVKNEPYVNVEEMPEFPGGLKALAAYLKQNLKYPLAALEDGIEGKVYITFVVNDQGTIEQAKLMRGIGGGCDQEALRVVNAMPKWKPGRQNGHVVKVYYTLPVSFVLAR